MELQLGEVVRERSIGCGQSAGTRAAPGEKLRSTTPSGAASSTRTAAWALGGDHLQLKPAWRPALSELPRCSPGRHRQEPHESPVIQLNLLGELLPLARSLPLRR